MLDTELGAPAVGVHVTLYRLSDDGRPLRLTQALTDGDGRVRDLLERPLVAGDYRLEFELGPIDPVDAHRRPDDGASSGASRSTCTSPTRRRSYHVPLLLAPYLDDDLPGQLRGPGRRHGSSSAAGRDTLAVTRRGHGSAHGSRRPPASHRRQRGTRSRRRPPGSGSTATGSWSSGWSSATRPSRRSCASGRPATRADLVERAIRIGLLALQDAGVTVNVDVVRAEFEKLVRQAESVNEKAAQALEQTLRTNFADGDGRLPRTLEKFLGDRGALRSMVEELFDESKRDSAIGRIGRMLERYFDGDASKLALLLDPTRLNSPMHQFRQEISAGFKGLEERLVAIEAAAAARGAERARSAAKGADFEDLARGHAGRPRPRRRRPARPDGQRSRARSSSRRRATSC